MKKSKYLACFGLGVTLALGCAVFPATMQNDIALAEDKYTVTFKLDENTIYETQEVNLNGYAQVPVTPEIVGKTFNYWKQDSEKFSFRTKITQNTILMANWTSNVTIFIVTFMNGDEVFNTQYVEEGNSAIMPTQVPQKTGFKFASWDKTDLTNITKNTVVNAQFETQVCKVHFWGLNNEDLGIVDVNYGENATLPQNLEREHHSFVPPEASVLENITEDCDIKLTYMPLSYNVIFDVDGQTFATASVDYNNIVAFPGIPAKENYIFMGWFDGNQVFDFNTKIEDNLTLYANFVAIEKPKFEVKFMVDNVQYGGTQLVEEGQSAVLPGTPYKEGYDFVGWSGEWNNITTNLTLQAIFKIKNYTVTILDFDGGEIAVQTVLYGENATEPDLSIFVREGYDFVGFDNSFRNIIKDTVITAVYKIKTFKVMFYNDDFTKIGTTQIVEYGKDAVPPTVSKIGFNFVGWSGGNYENVKDDLVLFATYEKQMFDVVYHISSSETNTMQVGYGECAELLMPTQEDFVFENWYTDENLTQKYDFSTPVTTSLTLFAKWIEVQQEIVMHTVAFFSDGEKVGEQQVVDGQSAITPPTPSKIGHTFVEWDNDFSNVTADLVINAVFEKNTYIVKFFDGKTLLKTENVKFQESATAPENLTKEGFTFVGWDNEFDSVMQNLKVNAVYEINKYEVKFFVDGKLFNSQVVEYNCFANIPATPQKVGHIFVEWQVENNNQTVAFAFNAPITSNVEVNAKFKAKTYLISYFIDGKLYQTQEVAFGEEITLLQVDEREDFEFSGWSAVPSTMPAENLTVYGTFKSVPKVLNNIVFDVVQNESTVELTLKIKGEVKVAGLIAQIEYDAKNLSVDDCIFDENYAFVFDNQQGVANFVYGRGNNLTEATQFAKIIFEIVDGVAFNKEMLSGIILEIYQIDENDDIVEIDYTIN